jgi:hypothetical protein
VVSLRARGPTGLEFASAPLQRSAVQTVEIDRDQGHCETVAAPSNLMSAHRKRREASDPLGAARAEGAHPTEEAKPGAPRKRPNKGGKEKKQRTLSGRPGIAKKSAGARSGTDRSRHKRIDKRKHRGTSLSPSIR